MPVQLGTLVVQLPSVATGAELTVYQPSDLIDADSVGLFSCCIQFTHSLQVRHDSILAPMQ